MSSRSRFDILEENNRRPRRVCVVCGRAMASSYKGDTCQECKEEAIYPQVKEYVLHHDVGELEVAEKFDIPVSTVRKWVRLGYMDYKDDRKSHL